MKMIDMISINDALDDGNLKHHKDILKLAKL